MFKIGISKIFYFFVLCISRVSSMSVDDEDFSAVWGGQIRHEPATQFTNYKNILKKEEKDAQDFVEQKTSNNTAFNNITFPKIRSDSLGEVKDCGWSELVSMTSDSNQEDMLIDHIKEYFDLSQSKNYSKIADYLYSRFVSSNDMEKAVQEYGVMMREYARSSCNLTCISQTIEEYVNDQRDIFACVFLDEISGMIRSKEYRALINQQDKEYAETFLIDIERSLMRHEDERSWQYREKMKEEENRPLTKEEIRIKRIQYFMKGK